MISWAGCTLKRDLREFVQSLQEHTDSEHWAWVQEHVSTPNVSSSESKRQAVGVSLHSEKGHVIGGYFESGPIQEAPWVSASLFPKVSVLLGLDKNPNPEFSNWTSVFTPASLLLSVFHFVLVCSTAEAVLQEMDNISSIRQNREVERLRMWTGDTEEVSLAPLWHATCDMELEKYHCLMILVWTRDRVKVLFFQENMDMYSRVKRRKSMRRSTFSIPTHHKVMSKTEEEEEEGTEGQFPTSEVFMNHLHFMNYLIS